MSNNKYWRVTKWLGGIAIICIAFGYIFAALMPALFSEQLQNSVLVNAIPFFAIFVGILLMFILFIVLLAMRFNGKIPGRTYRSVEQTIVAGILFSIVCLFQAWSFVPYRYGFLLLLGSTLAFIVWSHILGPRTEFNVRVPHLTSQQHIIGAVAGVLVLVALVASAANVNSPNPPYGVRQRVYDSYTEERKAEVAAEAINSFNNVEMPFLVVFSVFPGLATYLIVRELVHGKKSEEEVQSVAHSPARSIS